MARSKTIRVTPNVLKCAAVLRDAVKILPAGEAKKRALRALEYLDRTFSGLPQPHKGEPCPIERL
ncbi:MAG: hypothetical protein ABFD80_05690, partial [Acidobacteriota bacterium]